MANERITEDIVRDHFKKDPLFGIIKLDEQKTSNKSVDALLSGASKQGTGSGKPEFIITFPSGNMNYVMLLECKAETASHKSRRLDQPKDYAVDGVLHYGKHLVLCNSRSFTTVDFL